MARYHIAILKKPYLNLVLAGSKTIECRLSRLACPPFGRIKRGERILLKESGGPVRAQARAGTVRFFENLSPPDVEKILRDYNHLILGEPDYWTAKTSSRYATLIPLENVQPLRPYRLVKRWNMRAWIVCEK